jgi:hypothetical protein
MGARVRRLSAKAGQNDRPHSADQKILALRSKGFRSTKLVSKVGYNARRDQEKR